MIINLQGDDGIDEIKCELSKQGLIGSVNAVSNGAGEAVTIVALVSLAISSVGPMTKLAEFLLNRNKVTSIEFVSRDGQKIRIENPTSLQVQEIMELQRQEFAKDKLA
jgi:hypothetical protein